MWPCWVFAVVHGLSLAVVTLQFRCVGFSLWWLLSLMEQSERASVAVAHGLSCSAACGIFPDQGLNPCSLHWQADSYPLGHQGSPRLGFLKKHSGLGTTQEQEQGAAGAPWGPGLKLRNIPFHHVCWLKQAIWPSHVHEEEKLTSPQYERSGKATWQNGQAHEKWIVLWPSLQRVNTETSVPSGLEFQNFLCQHPE